MSPEASTRYDVRLSLGTDYAAPSDRVRLLSHLTLRDLPGRQTTLSQVLTVTPAPAERRSFPDFFGNMTTMIAYHAPVGGVQLDLHARVECMDAGQWLDLSPDLRGLQTEMNGERCLRGDAPSHFLGASARVPVVPDIVDFANAQSLEQMTALGLVESLGMALHGAMRFDPDSTDVDTPIAEAFARRNGVCQDFSHIMIGALRSLGVPAGYVSGFLRTEPPPGQPRLEGADAMHAWVRVWCGREMGWVEYDPTNACRAGADHLVVAFGRDYADVAPIQGVMVTAGEQSSHHSVDVVPVG